MDSDGLVRAKNLNIGNYLLLLTPNLDITRTVHVP